MAFSPAAGAWPRIPRTILGPLKGKIRRPIRPFASSPPTPHNQLAAKPRPDVARDTSSSTTNLSTNVDGQQGRAHPLRSTITSSSAAPPSTSSAARHAYRDSKYSKTRSDSRRAPTHRRPPWPEDYPRHWSNSGQLASRARTASPPGGRFTTSNVRLARRPFAQNRALPQNRPRPADRQRASSRRRVRSTSCLAHVRRDGAPARDWNEGSRDGAQITARITACSSARRCSGRAGPTTVSWSTISRTRFCGAVNGAPPPPPPLFPRPPRQVEQRAAAPSPPLPPSTPGHDLRQAPLKDKHAPAGTAKGLFSSTNTRNVRGAHHRGRILPVRGRQKAALLPANVQPGQERRARNWPIRRGAQNLPQAAVKPSPASGPSLGLGFVNAVATTSAHNTHPSDPPPNGLTNSPPLRFKHDNSTSKSSSLDLQQ